jgi:hypothetical protein
MPGQLADSKAKFYSKSRNTYSNICNENLILMIVDDINFKGVSSTAVMSRIKPATVNTIK